MKSPHLVALVSIAIVMFVAAVVLAMVAAGVDTFSYRFGTDPEAALRKAAINGLSNLALLVGILASIAGIVLAGVRHLLVQAVTARDALAAPVASSFGQSGGEEPAGRDGA